MYLQNFIRMFLMSLICKFEYWSQHIALITYSISGQNKKNNMLLFSTYFQDLLYHHEIAIELSIIYLSRYPDDTLYQRYSITLCIDI